MSSTNPPDTAPFLRQIVSPGGTTLVPHLAPYADSPRTNRIHETRDVALREDDNTYGGRTPVERRAVEYLHPVLRITENKSLEKSQIDTRLALLASSVHSQRQQATQARKRAASQKPRADEKRAKRAANKKQQAAAGCENPKGSPHTRQRSPSPPPDPTAGGLAFSIAAR